MDIARLNEFVTLAQYLNFSKAASRLYISQSALSKHISEIEELLGTPLFIRDTHSVRLTSMGKTFLTEAKEIVSRYQHVVNKIQQVSAAMEGRINFGFLSSTLYSALPDFVTSFNSKYPHSSLSVICDTVDNLTAMVLDGSLDCAVVAFINSSLSPILNDETVMWDHLIAAIHPDHPLAKRKSLQIRELSGVPITGFSEETNPFAVDYYKRLFKENNMELNLIETARNIETILFLVWLNRTITIIPRHLEWLVNELAIVPINDISFPLNIIWRKDNENLLLPVFKKELSEYLQNVED